MRFYKGQGVSIYEILEYIEENDVDSNIFFDGAGGRVVFSDDGHLAWDGEHLERFQLNKNAVKATYKVGFSNSLMGEFKNDILKQYKIFSCKVDELNYCASRAFEAGLEGRPLDFRNEANSALKELSNMRLILEQLNEKANKAWEEELPF